MVRLAEIYCLTGQAAVALAVSKLTIQRWVHEGQLTGERVGNVTLIPIAEVEILRAKRMSRRRRLDE